MSNFIRSGFSLFVSRRENAAPADKSDAAQAPLCPAANDHPSPDAAGAQHHGGTQMPLVPYPVLREEVAIAGPRASRALNLQRTSTSVALTSRQLSPPQAKVPRVHGTHQGRPILTKTERVRLQVMQVQIRLASLALYDGPIDGVMGPDTATGVRHFQTLKGLHDSGTLAPGTLSALGVKPID